MHPFRFWRFMGSDRNQNRLWKFFHYPVVCLFFFSFQYIFNIFQYISWFCKNFLAINHSKSQSIVFNRATVPTPSVIDSNELDYVPQIKLLGVIIDNSLSFKAHIKEICRKVNTKVSILRRKFVKLYPQIL